jgi:hypothetical protein
MYTYNYTATGIYAALNEALAAGTTVTVAATPATTYTLPTTLFTLFVFIKDVVGNMSINASVGATCAAGTVPLILSTGYFKLTAACTADLTIKNLDTAEIIFTNSTPITTLVYLAQLTRFIYPTI